MTSLPAAGYLSNAARTIAEQKQAFEDLRSVAAEMLGGAAETGLTIAGGVVTATVGIHNIDTEAAAATDDLDRITQTNTPDGRFIMIRPNNAGRTVVVRHAQTGAGQILLADAANFSMNSTKMWLLLQRRGTDWNEIGRFYGDQKAAMLTYLGAAALASAGTFTAAQVIQLATAGNNLTLETSDAGAVGAKLRFRHNTASPAASDDAATILFDGKDSGAADQAYGDIIARLLDATGASEDLLILVRAVVAGTMTNMLQLGPGAAFGAPTGGVPATVGQVNAVQFFDDNVALDAAIAAIQSEMEAASTTTRSVTPGRQHFHPGHPKAWVLYDNNGTFGITTDYGITSGTDVAVGRADFTFDVAFSALAAYGGGGMAEDQSGTKHNFIGRDNAGTHSAAVFPIITSSAGGTGQDNDYNFSSWNGDQ